MKLLTALTLSIIFLHESNAQPVIPAFGKIDKAELEIKTCDFEPNAEAMMLFDIGEYYCDIHPAMINPVMILNERRVRIKILNDKGLDNANIHIRYYSYRNSETVKSISAQTYNLDAAGNIVTTKMDKKSIFEKRINKRYSEVAFSLPEVKAGSVIEYKYTIEGGGRDEWYFQKAIPVVYSEFKVDFPSELEVQCTPYCSLPYKRKNDQSSRNKQIYSMEKIPALRNESFITCDEDYLQHVETRLVAVNFPGSPRRTLTYTWPQIVKSLMEDEDFGLQLKKDIPRTADLDLMLKDITDPYQKMCIIHEYVRKNMQWNEYDNIWALDGVKSAWKDKKGTSGEINLILVNLLKDAGLNAHPVLVSTRGHGMINVFIPSYYQFDKVMAYIEIDGKKYVLDATEKYTSSKLIPEDVMALQGMVIEKYDTNEWGWKTLWDEDDMYKNTIIISGEITKDGLMKGNASVTSYDYARTERMPEIIKGKEAFIKAFYTSQNPALKIDSLDFENEKTDSLPLIQNIQFTQQLSSSGDYQYFSTNLFSGLGKNPFIADTRFSDVFFGYKQKIYLIGNFTLPEEFIFEELPKNIKMMTPDSGIIFTRLAGGNGNLVSVKVLLDFNKPVFNTDEYPDFKEFYKKLFDFLNEQIVIKKKS